MKKIHKALFTIITMQLIFTSVTFAQNNLPKVDVIAENLQYDELSLYSSMPAGYDKIEPLQSADGRLLLKKGDEYSIIQVPRNSEFEQTKGDPTYTNKARYSDEGMESDHIYNFKDGEINPKYGEPILMVNGSFYASTPVIRKHRNLFVPLRAVAEALGADVGWNEEDKTLIIKLDDFKLEIKKGPYEAYEIFTSDTEGRQGYLEPEIIDDMFYVDVTFIARYFNLDTGYIIDSDASIKQGIALNPVVWLDSPMTQSFYEKASTDEYRNLKIWLTECLENGKSLFTEADYEERFDLEAPNIAKDIENIKYIGQAGRYALYKCPYIILVDMYTHDAYIHKSGNGYELIFKADANGYNLFRSIYLAE